MILQALTAYYDRLSGEGAVQGTGFQEKEIPWVIELDRGGRFVALRHTVGKNGRGRSFVVPAEVKKSANIAANLLWDNPEYVLGVARPELNEKQKAKVPQRQAAFIARLRGLPEPARRDLGVKAVLAFLEKGDLRALQTAEGWSDLAQERGNVSFRLAGEEGLVCERRAVRAAIAEEARGSAAKGQGAYCLVTGRRAPPTRLHASIRGVRGAQSSGASLVSFNLDAFTSHGWSQGANAPVSAAATHAYAAALNHLLGRGNERCRMVEGDTTFAFWAAARTPFEDRFADLFGSHPARPQDSDGTPLRETFESARRGLRQSFDDGTPFYVLGLAPNAARLAVRFWRAGSVADLAWNIARHFEDLEVVGLSGPSRLPSLFHLIGAAAREGDARRLQDNLCGQLAAGLLAAILDDLSYPTTLLARTVARCRAERSVWPVRAALIKASLNRRFPAKAIGISLDPDDSDPAYRLGRFFAVLESLQRTQSSSQITIRHRFFGAIMTAPRSIVPRLIYLKNTHLQKLYRGQARRGLATFFEHQIGKILDALGPQEELPVLLSLEEQGRFLLGYHHQRSFRSGSKDVDAALGATSEPQPAE